MVNLLVVDMESVVLSVGSSRFPQLAYSQKAVDIRAIKKYVIVCDRSAAQILCDAAKKYWPEAVPEIDAVFKLASYP